MTNKDTDATSGPLVKRVWLFDINRRVYRRDERGKACGSPIWRDHWVEHEVVGETSRSWITKWGRKVPKKGGYGIAFNEAEIDRLAYVHDNQHKIADAVMRCYDYATLLRVAEAVGYKGANEMANRLTDEVKT